MENRKVETGIGQAEAAEEQTSLKSQNESGLRSSAPPKAEGPKCPKCGSGKLLIDWDKGTMGCSRCPFIGSAKEFFAAPSDPQVCKAQKSGVGGSDPQDCDWPFCDCDPKAVKVLEAIQESGYVLTKEAPSDGRVDSGAQGSK